MPQCIGRWPAMLPRTLCLAGEVKDAEGGINPPRGAALPAPSQEPAEGQRDKGNARARKLEVLVVQGEKRGFQASKGWRRQVQRRRRGEGSAKEESPAKKGEKTPFM